MKESYESKSNIHVDKFSSEELLDYIYKGESTPQDQRFSSYKNGGVFKYFDLDRLYQNSVFGRDVLYPYIEVDDIIVGISEIEKDTKNDDVFWFKFLSIDEKFRNNGYATKLIDQIFSYIKVNNGKLKISMYSDEGFDIIKSKIEEAAKVYNIELV